MSNCPRYGEKCHEFMCGSSMNGICIEGMSLEEVSRKIKSANIDDINEVIDKLISHEKCTVTMV